MLWNGLCRVGTPKNVMLVGWISGAVFCGYMAGQTLAAYWRQDPAYFCTVGSMCRSVNVTDIRCCREVPEDGELRSGIYVCRPACT